MTETNSLLWLPGSFYRRPEWRWVRAEFLLATGGRRDRRIDDGWVDCARDAIRGRGGEGSKAAVVRAARDVWEGDPSVRAELEALLLTDEPLDRIAGRVGLPVAVAEAFAEVFFCVRPMLKAIDWLLLRAVGFGAFRGFTSPLPWAAWKLAAVAGGPLLLDVVIAATTGRPLPNGCHKGSGRRGYKDALTRLRVRLWIATVGAVTDEEFAAVVRARQQLRALDARLTGRVTAVHPTLAAMEAFLMALPAMNRKAGVTVRLDEEPGGRSSSTAWAGGVAAEALPPECRPLADEIDALIAGMSPVRVHDPSPTEEVGTETDGTAATSPPERTARDACPHRLAG
jgi:hypothetical protein